MKKQKSIVLIVFISCLSGQVLGQHEKKIFDRKNMRGEFKHFNLKEFNIDSLTSQEKEAAIFKNGNVLSGQDTYYSSQKSKRGLIEFTIYSFDLREITDGYEITYLIYGLKGDLISSFQVASKFDGNGYFSSSSGNFLNDNTYELHSEYGEENYSKTHSKTITKINRDGKIEQQTTVVKTDKAPTH